eukprot:TRINITY_DN8358_c0_g1_i1.p2 TRINITY_DN8358_c0_g1~~TRINITY_DN8358_c0_g1_i1.p2  ORF type:complete len:168 (-),score=48.86 TRINITY_DN8358_c0_g1_i1:488-991(-)
MARSTMMLGVLALLLALLTTPADGASIIPQCTTDVCCRDGIPGGNPSLIKYRTVCQMDLPTVDGPRLAITLCTVANGKILPKCPGATGDAPVDDLAAYAATLPVCAPVACSNDFGRLIPRRKCNMFAVATTCDTWSRLFPEVVDAPVRVAGGGAEEQSLSDAPALLE